MDIIIGVQNPADMGISGQNDRIQKPAKEFSPKTAFLDGLSQEALESLAQYLLAHEAIDQSTLAGLQPNSPQKPIGRLKNASI